MNTATRASAAASATGASAATRTAARRNASSWYGSSRPVRARLDASDDGEPRQRRHATWISATLSRPSARSSNTSCSGRWRRRHVTSRRPPNNGCTANGSKLCRTSLRAQISSRLRKHRSRLLCSNSDVELHSSLENDFPRRHSRVENDLYRNRLRAQKIRANQLFGRAGDHVTFLGRAPRHDR